MRYATVVITPRDGGLNPADTVLVASSAVERDVVHQVNLLNDGTVVMLYALRGDIDEAVEELRDCESVIAVDGSGEEEGLIYLHIEPGRTSRKLMEIIQNNEVVLQTPLECTRDGGVRVTVVGDDVTIQQAVEEVPDDVAVSLEGIGDYHPEADKLYGTLTARQREVLETAVEKGYYEVPRCATHEDIAEEVGLSAGTVGEHLRKVEGRVLSSLVTR
ncbi:MAG: helix-turn-helix domain-containing protein [Haloglomus sp.]